MGDGRGIHSPRPPEVRAFTASKAGSVQKCDERGTLQLRPGCMENVRGLSDSGARGSCKAEAKAY